MVAWPIQPDVAVSQVGDDDLDDGAQVVHEVQDEAKMQGSEGQVAV